MTFARYKDLLDEYISSGRSKEKMLAKISDPSEIAHDIDGLVRAVKIIAASADSDIRSLVELTGLSNKEFSREYMIPYRSVQNWLAKGESRQADAVYIGYAMIQDLTT